MISAVTARRLKKQADGTASKKPPEPPIIFSIYASDIKRLEGLAVQKELIVAEIFHQALALYVAVSEAKAHHPQTRVLFDRGNGNHFELVFPF